VNPIGIEPVDSGVVAGHVDGNDTDLTDPSTGARHAAKNGQKVTGRHEPGGG
jgi:hypothetical protein